jgi:methyl-accepting chemotaxis protein
LANILLGLADPNRYNIGMNQGRKSKRIWLVNRDFQFRYAAAGLLAGLSSTIITATLIIYPLFAFKILTIGLFLPWPIVITITAAIVLNCILQIVFGLLLTHRIAGPIFNLVRYLRIIGRGHWNIKMNQRRHDELAMVIRHVNEMSEGLTKAVQDDLQVLVQIESLLKDAKKDPNKIESTLQAIENLQLRLQKRITAQGGII